LTEVLEQIQVGGGAAGGALAPAVSTGAAERLVRRDLRAQIARLERELGELFASAFPRHGLEWAVGALGGPRVLDTAELERVRDALVVRIREARVEIARQADVEEANRGLLEQMIADPDRYRWLRISNADIGDPGCRHWHSRPRWGILGMLLGWWRVRLSSGCPLAEGLRPPDRPQLSSTSKKKKKARRRRTQQASAPAATEQALDHPVGSGGEAEQPTGRYSVAKQRTGLDSDERPPAPWGSFPLVELVVLVGIGMIVGGFVVGLDEVRGQTLAATGLALASLAGLELSVREHFAGFRSHTTLLASAAAVATLVVLYYLVELSAVASLVAAALVGFAAGMLLLRVFRNKSGGRSVKIK
jgi:hypothetical protein